MYADVDDDDDGAGVDEGTEGVVDAAELESEVGTAAAVVDDEGRADVDGCTYVMDVPAATPVGSQYDVTCFLRGQTYSQYRYIGIPAGSIHHSRSWGMRCNPQLRYS